MKDLNTVSKQEQDAFFNSFDRILCDVDGVLWHFGEKIPGAKEALQSLKKLGKTITYVSNNCTKAHDFYYEQLKSAGFDLNKDDLIIPVLAMISYLKKQNFSKEVYVIGMTPIVQEFKNAGFKIAEYPSNSNDEQYVPEFLRKCVAENENVGAVVVDLDVNISYLRLQKAATYLKRPEVIFITGGSDSKLGFGPNHTVLGPGYFHVILEDMTGRKATCLAKPSSKLNDFIKEKFQITDPSRVLFIGDSIAEDMGFATNCGYKKLLVLSGLAKRESIKNWEFAEEFKPHYYVDSLKIIHDLLAQ